MTARACAWCVRARACNKMTILQNVCQGAVVVSTALPGVKSVTFSGDAEDETPKTYAARFGSLRLRALRGRPSQPIFV
jgi:hypothetical protein